MCVSFFCQIRFYFVFFGDIWVLRDPKFAKKYYEKPSTAWQGLIEHVYNQGLSPKNGVDVWTFVRKTRVIWVLVATYQVAITWLQYGINFGR